MLLGTDTSGHETIETNCGIADDLPASVTVGGPVEATSSTWVSKTGSVVAVHLSKTTEDQLRDVLGARSGNRPSSLAVILGIPKAPDFFAGQMNVLID